MFSGAVWERTAGDSETGWEIQTRGGGVGEKQANSGKLQILSGTILARLDPLMAISNSCTMYSLMSVRPRKSYAYMIPKIIVGLVYWLLLDLAFCMGFTAWNPFLLHSYLDLTVNPTFEYLPDDLHLAYFIFLHCVAMCVFIAEWCILSPTTRRR